MSYENVVTKSRIVSSSLKVNAKSDLDVTISGARTLKGSFAVVVCILKSIMCQNFFTATLLKHLISLTGGVGASKYTHVNAIFVKEANLNSNHAFFEQLFFIAV